MRIIFTLSLLFSSLLLMAQAGSLDETFGNRGITSTAFGSYVLSATSIGTQSDGKIVLAGYGEDGFDEDIVLVRYLPDGQLDADFGQEGRQSLNIRGFESRCFDLAIDPADNIYLTGIINNINFQRKGFVVKLNSDGELDVNFADDGVWISDVRNDVEDYQAILFQEDNKILVAGMASVLQESNRCILVRLFSDGGIDMNFGNNGFAEVVMPENYNPQFAQRNSKGDIITGGFLLGNSTDVVLVKFDSEGKPDSTFGEQGIMVDDTNVTEFARSMVIQDDDKILVGAGVDASTVDDFGLIRYNEDGTLDQSFGTGGRVATDFFQSRNTAHSILLQEDGKIILGGFAGTNPNRNFAIARYDETGQLDETFGNSGKVSTDFGFNDFLFTMTLQADGKLLGAGHSVTANDASLFSIARYNTRTGTSVQDFIPGIDLVELFPNPSRGEFTLWFESAQSTTAAISLINAKGQLVQNISDAHKITEGVNQLDFSLADQVGAGVFFLKIATSEGTLFKKLIVTR